MSLADYIAAPPAPVCDPTGHCITCSDEGVPMRVTRHDEALGLARCVDEAGAEREVETALVHPVAVGVVLLVHADVAIALLEEAPA